MLMKCQPALCGSLQTKVCSGGHVAGVTKPVKQLHATTTASARVATTADGLRPEPQPASRATRTHKAPPHRDPPAETVPPS